MQREKQNVTSAWQADEDTRKFTDPRSFPPPPYLEQTRRRWQSVIPDAESDIKEYMEQLEDRGPYTGFVCEGRGAPEAVIKARKY